LSLAPEPPSARYNKTARKAKKPGNPVFFDRQKKPAQLSRLRLSKNRFAGFFSTSKLRRARRFRRFPEEKRRDTVFFPARVREKLLKKQKSPVNRSFLTDKQSRLSRAGF